MSRIFPFFPGYGELDASGYGFGVRVGGGD